MNVLILGGGGREHALYEKIRKSPLVQRVYGAPGNAGFGQEDRIAISPDNFIEIEKQIRNKNISFVVIGPEQPLVAGIRDYLKEKFPEIYVFGPDANAAQLEGSKEFACEFMRNEHIPFADTQIAQDYTMACTILETLTMPVVIKADGLAGGKGVSIHEDTFQAEKMLSQLFQESVFGEAGHKVLFQKFLTGNEASLFAICNGKEAIYLPPARDYKRVSDYDKGENTGGMGAVCPGMTLSDKQISWCHENITRKVLNTFSYRGLLYIGLMIHSEADHDLSVIEFNCRFGDPETQSVLPMIAEDIMPYLLWSDNHPDVITLQVKKEGFFQVPVFNKTAINVTVSAKGYPALFRKKIPIKLPEVKDKSLQVIHAGTELENNTLISTSGRVFNIVCITDSAIESRTKIYQYLSEFDTLNEKDAFHYRKDIG